VSENAERTITPTDTGQEGRKEGRLEGGKKRQMQNEFEEECWMMRLSLVCTGTEQGGY
jgi:hypothetical protein